MGGGYTYVKINELKKLTFKEGSGAINEEKPPSYELETTLVLSDGTRIPVANLLRISSQRYSAVPLSGVEEVNVFEQLNDVGFLQEKNAPTIKFEEVKSMEFPTEDTIVLTLKRLMNDNGDEDKSDTLKEAKADKVRKEDIDEDYEFLKGDLGDLDIDFGQDEDDAGLLGCSPGRGSRGLQAGSARPDSRTGYGHRVCGRGASQGLCA